MSAQLRTRPAVVRSPSSLPVRRPDRLRRQLLVERVFFLALVVLLAVIAVRQARALRVYQITVNGRPVVTVSDHATAQRLLNSLTGDIADARFRQQVAVQKVSARAMVVVPDKLASVILSRAVSVVVPAHVILMNGRVAAALATKQEAEQALARARRQLAGAATGTALAQSARIEPVEFDRSKIVTPSQAVNALVAKAGPAAARQASAPAGRIQGASARR